MRIAPIGKKSTWDEVFNRTGSHSFLQSWEWGDFNEAEGHKIFRLGIFKGTKPIGVALTLLLKSKRGTFLFVPHGPAIIPLPEVPLADEIANETVRLYYEECLGALKEYLIERAQEEKCAFIRIAPVFQDSPGGRALFKKLGFSQAPIYMHSERVWTLPLAGRSEEELLADMRKTTRYLIRRAPRENVQVEARVEKKSVDDFYKIYKVTASREHFTPFSKTYIEHEFEAFSKTGNALFLFGYHDGQPLASALIVFTASTAFYHQGASIHSQAPVTYAVQFRAIQEAKKRGCSTYNFWGIYHKGRTPKAWEGLTLFKKGFGGGEVNYVPTQDYVVRPTYFFTFLYEKFLALRRGV